LGRASAASEKTYIKEKNKLTRQYRKGTRRRLHHKKIGQPRGREVVKPMKKNNFRILGSGDIERQKDGVKRRVQTEL